MTSNTVGTDCEGFPIKFQLLTAYRHLLRQIAFIPLYNVFCYVSVGGLFEAAAWAWPQLRLFNVRLFAVLNFKITT